MDMSKIGVPVPKAEFFMVCLDDIVDLSFRFMLLCYIYAQGKAIFL